MGLMLSILIGCVGVTELLACLRHVTDGVVITINQPATPCLSYHEPVNDNMSTHDSICTFSHSSDARLPRSAKHKLENLHEYSLRIRSELRSMGKNFDSNTLSECSTRDFLLASRRTPDSRLSPDFNYLVRASESQDDQRDAEDNNYGDRYEREASFEDTAETWRVESSSRDRPLSVIASEPEKYVRIPTPIPFNAEDAEYSSSSDVGTSFDNDSGNEAPTMKSFESIPMIKRYKSPSEGGSSVDESDYNEKRKIPRKLLRKSHSKSPEPSKAGEEMKVTVEDARTSKIGQEVGTPNRGAQLQLPEIQREVPRGSSSQRKRTIKSSSTIVRKSTKLKSRNAEISKSAENLSGKKSKRHRDPERRKSDISVQTVSNFLKDEWTNTSPPGSPTTSVSRTDSRKSVSVQVQTSFEEELPRSLNAVADLEGSVVGLSESRRDLASRDRFGRRTFKNRRFGSGSRDKVDVDNARDNLSVTNATASVERSKDEARLLKISSFEEADDEDYQRIRNIVRDSDSGESNERRKMGSRSVSSFEDEEYLDAEDVSAGTGPIRYSIPDPDRNKAFWVMMQVNSASEAPLVSLRVHPLVFPSLL